MTSQNDKAKRWRPRRIIVLAVGVLTVVAIAGFWVGWWSVPSVEEEIRDAQVELLQDIMDEVATKTPR